jgi:hypothetical protein
VDFNRWGPVGVTARHRSNFIPSDCHSRHAVRIEPVSNRGLPKAGGDFRRLPRETGQIWSLETDSRFAKARYSRAFLQLLGVVSPSSGLAGWSERIRTRAFPIEPGLCVRFSKFGNMAGVRPRPGQQIPAWQMEMPPNSGRQPEPDRRLQRRHRHSALTLQRPNSNAVKDLM